MGSRGDELGKKKEKWKTQTGGRCWAWWRWKQWQKSKEKASRSFRLFSLSLFLFLLGQKKFLLFCFFLLLRNEIKIQAKIQTLILDQKGKGVLCRGKNSWLRAVMSNPVMTARRKPGRKQKTEKKSSRPWAKGWNEWMSAGMDNEKCKLGKNPGTTWIRRCPRKQCIRKTSYPQEEARRGWGWMDDVATFVSQTPVFPLFPFLMLSLCSRWVFLGFSRVKSIQFFQYSDIFSPSLYLNINTYIYIMLFLISKGFNLLPHLFYVPVFIYFVT